jgi:ABC-type transport system substrate-binding protein
MVAANPPDFTPATNTNIEAQYVGGQLYNTLIRMSNKREFQGVFAELWKISPDGKSYTFKLRKGVKCTTASPSPPRTWPGACAT